MGGYGGQERPRDVRRQQPVVVLAERGRDPHGIIDAPAGRTSGVNRPFDSGVGSSLFFCPCRWHGSFRGHDLMLMSGPGTSTFRTTSAGRQPIERCHRDTVPVGHHRPGISSAISAAAHAAVFAVSHSKTVPSVQMQCRMTASFRATATCAFFVPTRFARRTPHAGQRLCGPSPGRIAT